MFCWCLSVTVDYFWIKRLDETSVPGSFVEEGNLTRNVSTLRKALGESPQDHQYIITIPARGYRFSARVIEIHDESCALIVEEHSLSQIVIEHEEVANVTEFQPKPLPLVEPKASPIPYLVACGLLVAGVLALYLIVSAPRSASPFSQIDLVSLTTSGDVYAPTISPDGKFLAYSSVGPEGGGLDVRQIATEVSASGAARSGSLLGNHVFARQ